MVTERGGSGERRGGEAPAPAATPPCPGSGSSSLSTTVATGASAVPGFCAPAERWVRLLAMLGWLGSGDGVTNAELRSDNTVSLPVEGGAPTTLPAVSTASASAAAGTPLNGSGTFHRRQRRL